MTCYLPLLGADRTGLPRRPPGPRWGQVAYHHRMTSAERGFADTVRAHACPGALVTDLIAQHFKPLLGVEGVWPPFLRWCS